MSDPIPSSIAHKGLLIYGDAWECDDGCPHPDHCSAPSTLTDVERLTPEQIQRVESAIQARGDITRLVIQSAYLRRIGRRNLADALDRAISAYNQAEAL